MSTASLHLPIPRGLARLLAVSLLVLAWLAMTGATPAHAATEPITVSLYRVQEISCNEGPGVSCPNDYYPQFKIDGKGCTNKDDCTSGSWEDKDEFCCAEQTDFRPNWTRTVDIDTTKNVVDIQIELWDQDDTSPDDPIHWVSGRDDLLDLKFDRTTCIFTGGGLTAAEGAGVPGLAGQSESNGSDSARGYFTITTPSCIAKSRTTDSDGDGILDAQESPGGGVDGNGDGTVDVKLFDDYGALPYRKDLFVEEDYMAGDKPQPNVIADVQKVFADAPVDDARGVNLHIDEATAEQVPNVPGILFQTNGPGNQDDFNDLKSGNPAGPCTGFFGTAADRASANCANILKAKRQVFRYMIFGDSYAETPGSSGISEWKATGAPGGGPMGGNDFMVTVGAWGPVAMNNVGGRKSAEASTFMHEFGHTLSLGHGGADAINCKPIYLSVMNYTLQFPNFDKTRRLDYTSAAKGTALGLTPATLLDETSLDENKGVFGTPNPARTAVWGWFGLDKEGPATSGPMDWNNKNGANETGLTGKESDVNYILSITPSSSNGGCSTPSQGEKLSGYDDWAHIQYDPKIDVADFADGARPNVPTELTEKTVLAMSQKANVNIAKTADQAEAVPGDTVSYTTTVGNKGPGKAQDIKVTDTLPDGTKVDRTVPDLDKDATNAITPKFTYLVPCATTNGTVLTNTVTVDANDTDGVPDPFTDDNTSSATTKVNSPVLTLAKTATPTVDAGDPITYTLAYANSGGAGASGVAITDTLPAGVYYSQALDTGTGPKPDTVTRNPNGTTTLTWTPGTLAASSGDKTITYTARPSMLFGAGEKVANSAKLTFGNVNGCTFDPLSDSATTTITAAPLFGAAESRGHWASHPADWTDPVLARVQATDQRFDSLDPAGLLTAPEVDATLKGDSELDNVLRAQLLTLFLNMGARHIGPDSLLDSTRAERLGLVTVRDAVLFAQATLALPAADNKERYQDAIQVVQETSDIDGDGLSNSAEADLGTNPASADTDGDGFADGQDGCPTVPGSANGCPAPQVQRAETPAQEVLRVPVPSRSVPVFAKRLVPAGVTLKARKVAAGRRAVTITARGTVVPAAGASAAQACREGRVTMVVKAGAMTLSRRAVRLASDCSFTSAVRIAKARIGKRNVSVRAYFTGNDVMQRRTSRPVAVR